MTNSSFCAKRDSSFFIYSEPALHRLVGFFHRFLYILRSFPFGRDRLVDSERQRMAVYPLGVARQDLERTVDSDWYHSQLQVVCHLESPAFEATLLMTLRLSAMPPPGAPCPTSFSGCYGLRKCVRRFRTPCLQTESSAGFSSSSI